MPAGTITGAHFVKTPNCSSFGLPIFSFVGVDTRLEDSRSSLRSFILPQTIQTFKSLELEI